MSQPRAGRFTPVLCFPSAKLGRKLMINYAVVGAGWISQQAFLPGVVQSGNSRVAAIVTGDRAKAARLADFYGIGMVVGYDGYAALLASPAIDAVYIALPNHMHADYAIRAASAGKHVMVEKPLAVSEDEGLAMIAAARSANVFLMTAYRLHHEPGTVAVLEHIRANAIGRPLFFQSVFSFETATRLRLRRDGKIVETQFPQIDHFGAQVGYFSDCIRSGTPPEADGDEGLADMRALIAIERAASTGIPQAISAQPRSRRPTPEMVRLTPITERRLVL